MDKKKTLTKHNSALTLWEALLLAIFLAFATSTSIFLLFVNSSEIQNTETIYRWVRLTNEKLDEIQLLLSDSLAVIRPFYGTSTDCAFIPVPAHHSTSNLHLQSILSFSAEGLIYIPSDEQIDKSELIIPDCIDGNFERTESDQLIISLTLKSPLDLTSKIFKRTINLRNQ